MFAFDNKIPVIGIPLLVTQWQNAKNVITTGNILNQSYGRSEKREGYINTTRLISIS